MAGGPIGLRRSPPVVPFERSVARERVVAQLADRFNVRLVTLTAHAGCGKTTALALGMEANRIDPWGTDVWVALDRRDDDPDRLLAAIGEALGAGGGSQAGLDDIVDAVWSAAPDDVAIILDDAHVLDSAETLDALREMIGVLPTNGHVVLASRVRLALPVARWRAQFDIVELDADDLALDEDEIAALVDLRRRHASSIDDRIPDDLPRVAALADLTLRFGAQAGAEFLWDEVLGTFAPRELEALRRLALVGTFGADFVDAVRDSTGVALEVDDLALVDRHEADRFEMHDLMRSALLDPLRPAQRRLLASATAEDSERIDDRSLSVVLHAEAGNAQRAMELARSFIMTATLRRTYEQIKRVSSVIDQIDRSGPLASFLRAELRSSHAHTVGAASQAAEFAAVADAAREQGDDEVEAAANYRCHQQSLFELLPVQSERIDRIGELASRVPYAAQVLRFARASQHLRNGDSASAWAEIVDLEHVADPASEQVFRAGLMCLLGRFDEVVDEFGSRDASSLAAGVDEYVAYALYLSGRVSPEAAIVMFDDVVAGIARAELAQTSVLLFTTGALISVHAGDHERAESYLARAREVTRAGCAASYAINVDTAGAVLAMSIHDEDSARSALDVSFAQVDLGRWPTAAHLTVLPLVYLLYPAMRERLDACEFGRPATIARAAGRALVAARDHDDAGPTSRLPWSEPDLLRVHVPPPLLAELAATAVEAGVAAAEMVLSTIPHVDRWLRRSVRRGGPGGRAAAAILAGRPRVLDQALHVAVLGPTTVERGGVLVDHPDLSRRARVRELLGLLVDRRSIPRTEAAELLWPDLEAKASANNLRVTLAYLNRALEPERATEESPIYVSQQGDDIALHTDVTSDLDAFRAAVRTGASHVRQRAPRSAIASYQRAGEMYRGEFLAGHDSGWLDGTRTSARFDAVHAFLRAGELMLASGEPETAMRWALRAREIVDHDHDGIERLLAGCRLATGDRAGAVATLRNLIAALTADGVEPESETTRMLRRITV